ncbi:MAG: hypothetical protein WHT07_01190 [Desulfobaccales bacterium]
MELLTRKDLAKRWRTTVRTIDRRRIEGLLPWIDLTAGKGRKPQVRFRIEDVEAYEAAFLQAIHQGRSGKK